MARGRGTTRKESKPSTKNEVIPVPQLPPRDEQPPKLILLPKDASPDSKFVSLANPSNGQLSRYLYCPKKGFYELIQVGSLGANSSSCLLVPQKHDNGSESIAESQNELQETILGSGYITENAPLLVATPMDPKLLMMSLFKPEHGKKGHSGMARSVEQIFDDLAKTSKHIAQLLRYPSVHKLFEGQLEVVCDCVDAMDDKAYKPNLSMMLEVLLKKARNIVKAAWPASLEAYIQKQLELPAFITATRDSQNEDDDGHAPGNEALPTERIENAHNSSLPSEPQRAPEQQKNLDPSDDVMQQMRLKTAIDFVFSSYVPPDLKSYFESIVASGKVIDLTQVNEHLSKIEKLKQEAQTLRSLSENVSRKRSAENDEAQEIKAEKRRKKEEDEKKRKQESRAIKDLKKTDTSGMKKLSSFFTKNTPIPTS